jgi:glyoxylase-like metal-dependent hydrolase (beta-lactamase superfamily II)
MKESTDMSTGFNLRTIYRVGYCLQRGIFADRSLGWEKVRFYALAFLIEHPVRGRILIDTGYGSALLDATKRGIYSLYRRLLPVTLCPHDSVVEQLALDTIDLHDLSYLIITHFHPDHIGALPEFSRVPWIYRADALEQLLRYSPLRGLSHGFIRTLIPSVPSGSLPITKEQFTGSWNGLASYDLFHDASLHLVDLPGHALGQMGVATNNDLFIADARWGRGELPSPMGFLIQHDIRAYCATSRALRALPPSIKQHQTHIIEAHA